MGLFWRKESCLWRLDHLNMSFRSCVIYWGPFLSISLIIWAGPGAFLFLFFVLFTTMIIYLLVNGRFIFLFLFLWLWYSSYPSPLLMIVGFCKFLKKKLLFIYTISSALSVTFPLLFFMAYFLCLLPLIFLTSFLFSHVPFPSYFSSLLNCLFYFIVISSYCRFTSYFNIFMFYHFLSRYLNVSFY